VNDGWKFIFHEDAMKLLLAMRGTERDRMFRLLEQLINDPYQRPDAYRMGAEGRKYFIKYLAGHRVCYWIDSFVKEFRVVDIERPAR
jgi:hypothetical protein